MVFIHSFKLSRNGQLYRPEIDVDVNELDNLKKIINPDLPIPKILTTTVDGLVYACGFKTFKEKGDRLESLALRRSPTVCHYKQGEWYNHETRLPNFQLIVGNSDAGGYWCGRTFSDAKHVDISIQRTKNPFSTRIFKVLIGDVLYFNQRSIKTNKIYLLEEMV